MTCVTYIKLLLREKSYHIRSSSGLCIYIYKNNYRTCIGQYYCNIKCRSVALAHSACMKSMVWTITIKAFTLASITATENTL